ncbi:MAG: FAD-binding oxidoreductase [Bacteroidetes bacterium]|nr:FAD-binding oxidoreductase [Bacteroidota bacterium]
MNIDFLIIGQGISGSFLSYFLLENGATVLVLDQESGNRASHIASGMINPVTGRIVATTWMIRELLQFSDQAYGQLGSLLNENFISEKNILTIPPTLQMQEALEKRCREKNTFIRSISENEASMLQKKFHYHFDPKKIQPSFLINVQALLISWKQYLEKKQCYQKDSFDFNALTLKKNGIEYKNIYARKIIFCNGIETFNYAPWKNLPYTITKGEALIVEIPDLENHYIYKSGSLSIAPWKQHLWWIGSSFEHQFKDALPSKNFRLSKEMELNQLLKIPFKVVDHFSSLRPGCIERKPFIGIHPQSPSLAILNGMGIKGCSLAPFFAKQLADHLVHGKSIEPMADVERFKKVLRRL